ncbi:sensor histidine kinase [Thiobacillus sedimenti]|uniref:histidine kinase n=1 Tax=Thiobacillus sedimenti TaxID=3110231 RepID=A0ABZ1CKT8_9PROT|nr:sensor histidine kinase [Thiobacillus sp. SCUT-2]WRS40004.1 sensor histidine kinase [Thiobacillus sp. SCUT-2]
MSAGKQASLRRQLIVRMLAMMLPLFILLWVIAYFSSQYFINAAFDRSLIRRTYALADRVEVLQGQVQVDLPVAARELLVFDQEDLLFHSVVNPAGQVIDGEQDMPPLPAYQRIRPGQLILYDGVKDGERVRVAVFALSLKGTSARGTALVEVGETLSHRSAMADRATLAIVAPMLLMTLTAALAIAYGVGRGLEPLSRLRDRLSARKAFDLSPVPLEETPAELRPFLDEINSLLQRLSEAVESQSRFVADAAHQLRTPIAGIRAQAEAALASARQEDARHALERIAQSSETMGTLVQKLLILARVDAAENTLRLVRLDGVEVVREVAREWVPQALAKGVEIGFETRDSEAWVMGDAQLLHEMLSNLIDNALRYGGTRIGLMVHRSGHEVAWRVVDNGPGIPEAQRTAVFAPFHRLSGSVDGAGLGLTIVQRIAQLHGAQVRLQAGEGGVGLAVDVIFPAAPA